MNMDWKKIGGGLILVIGVFAFILSISNNNLNEALIYLTATLIIWVLYGLLMDVFDVRVFSCVISISGFIVALSIFFMFGIEEVPHPVGAVIFHSGGIASALGIVFFSLFPVLIMYLMNSKTLPKLESIIKNGEPLPETGLESDDWELATEEELQSNEWDIA